MGRMWKKYSEDFYSNCFIEMLKAKLKNWNGVTLYKVPPRKNGFNPFPHFMWSDGEYDYDFGTEGFAKWYHFICFKGHIRQWKLGSAQKWIRYNSKK